MKSKEPNVGIIGGWGEGADFRKMGGWLQNDFEGENVEKMQYNPLLQLRTNKQ